MVIWSMQKNIDFMKIEVAFFIDYWEKMMFCVAEFDIGLINASNPRFMWLMEDFSKKRICHFFFHKPYVMIVKFIQTESAIVYKREWQLNYMQISAYILIVARTHGFMLRTFLRTHTHNVTEQTFHSPLNFNFVSYKMKV